MEFSEEEKSKKEINKIVLAYSGGLDTSIIIPWLKENYQEAEIVCVCINVGQEEEWDMMDEKARKSGASRLYIVDAREEFVEKFLFVMLRAGAIYENKYLLGTSIARPLQARYQVEVALKEKAYALAHRCTGKGNDQIRFELTYKALTPHLEVIAPWRMWNIRSREEAIEYAKSRNIPIGNVSKKNIYYRDWNIWHMSHEGGDLENAWNRPREEMFLLTKSPQDAPDQETEVIIDFEKGMPVGLNGRKLKPLEILYNLNRLGKENGIGRTDVVETRVVGMKSRGVYETPGGTILNAALREIEMMTLDSDTLHFKQTLAMKYAELIYQGKWYTTLRESMEAFMEKACEFITGSVRLYLYKGNIIIGGRKSPYSQYQEDPVSFGESAYNHADATGFINLFGLFTGVTSIVHKRITSRSGQTQEIKELASFHEK
ncbi:MAG: argininosuccinate synthase [Spirochaetes bacterium]|nr:MAG: argininosuccinate synthase [Spirochaetota bacterium]